MSLRNPMHGKIEIDTSCLPDPGKSEMDFLDSSFFSINPGRRLPHPVEVTSRSQDWKTSPNPITVRFEEMNLLVKFGPRVKTEEALNLRVIKKHLPDTVPVPEVYGWKIEGSCVFIYMELIRGESLHDRWDSLEASDKESLCHQLREIVSSIRQIEPGSGDSLIGPLTHRPIQDIVFEGMPLGGPFTSIKEFNDWFSSLPQRGLPDSQKYLDPYRQHLTDSGAIKFTHGDLHRGNILISSQSPPQVVALLDWAHAGWYPDYWEYCKALYTADYNDEWRSVWIPTFLDPYPMEFEVFAEYVMQIGCV